MFVKVILWIFLFCIPSQCCVTTTKNKVLVPIRTHTALTHNSQTSFHKQFPHSHCFLCLATLALASPASSLPPWVLYAFSAGCLKLSVSLTLLAESLSLKSVFIVASESFSWWLTWGIQIVSLSKRSCVSVGSL